MTDAYLFVHFIDKKHNTNLSEQVYFSVSQDGNNWDVLNGGQPILVSELGEKGVRDPFIIRAAEGDRFFLIGTDLNVSLRSDGWKTASINGSDSILVWESEDLVHWSDARLCRIAPEGAGCTWAPEVVYDHERKNYMVFWASAVMRGERRKHCIFRATTTDFRTFSAPEIFIERDREVIDTDIVFDGKHYYRFSKDETVKTITLEVAEQLYGPYTTIDTNLSNVFGVEGPQCFQTKDGTWCLLLDEYQEGNGYKPYLTDDLAGGQFMRDPRGLQSSMKLRHGGVLPITKEEYDRLLAAFA